MIPSPKWGYCNVSKSRLPVQPRPSNVGPPNHENLRMFLLRTTTPVFEPQQYEPGTPLIFWLRNVGTQEIRRKSLRELKKPSRTEKSSFNHTITNWRVVSGPNFRGKIITFWESVFQICRKQEKKLRRLCPALCLVR